MLYRETPYIVLDSLICTNHMENNIGKVMSVCNAYVTSFSVCFWVINMQLNMFCYIICLWIIAVRYLLSVSVLGSYIHEVYGFH
ncbi:hypothetical protein XENTR_v10022785 [Xenopus tropicalis]|nr:hypothetical protein XENTR_v10022785 [Xenopus tropicalis]